MTVERTFQAYEGATMDTPAFHLVCARLLPRFRPLLRSLFILRWRLSRPFQVRVMPKWFPLIPGLKSACFVTYGQLVLALPLLLLVLAGYTKSFLSPDLDQSGQIAAFAILAAFLTANKSNSFLSLFLGIPFERLIPFHNFSSLVAIILSTFHTYVAFAYGDSDESNSRDRRLSEDSEYAKFGSSPDLIKFLFDGSTNTSGTIIILCMLGLVATSFFSIIRRWFFEFWLFTHITCAVGVIVFCVAHSVSSIFLVAFWWGLDVFFRYIIMSMCLYPKKASLELVSPDVVEVRFPKTATFSYNAGQYVQISFPGIAPLQFHPITISSAPHEEEVTLHIRVFGNWSKRLAKLAEKHSQTNIMLEGPYGSLAMDLDDDDRYQMVLLISGGIGVTPCQSLARSILHQHQQGRKLEKLQFVWAVQHLNMAMCLPPPEVTESINAAVLSTNVYVTRAEKQDEEQAPTIDKPFNIHEGRPKFDAIFEKLKTEANEKGLTHIAVIACGPTSMLDNVRAACRDYSDSDLKCAGVKFNLHEEMFDF